VATGIAPMDLLDPELPPGFLELMIAHHRDMTEKG
jgi:hypothetical protein